MLLLDQIGQHFPGPMLVVQVDFVGRCRVEDHLDEGPEPVSDPRDVCGEYIITDFRKKVSAEDLDSLQEMLQFGGVGRC